ncbi:hypothetical protein ZWY2020_020788, partial [Hordeum vulgare]
MAISTSTCFASIRLVSSAPLTWTMCACSPKQHVQVKVKKNMVCDGPMTKKCKSTVLLMGGTHSLNVIIQACFF